MKLVLSDSASISSTLHINVAAFCIIEFLLAMPLGRCITNVQVILILSNTELSFALAAAL